MGKVTEGALRELLRTEWGLGGARLERLRAGHTNISYRVHSRRGPCVLRVSWTGKTIAQTEREAHALCLATAHLTDVAIPAIRPTRDGRRYVATADGRCVHVFDHIPGVSGLPLERRGLMEHAMRTLAELHAALSRSRIEAIEVVDPADWLLDRFRRVRERPTPSLAWPLNNSYETMLGHIGAQLAAAPAWLRGPVQWLHGDFHAGNLLFDSSRIRGIVDFDEVGQGSAWLEAAFAAFALCRDADNDDGFRFDANAWHRAVIAYAGERPGAQPIWWISHRDALVTLFCVDQVLIHLEAAQRGSWTPGAGMGFLGCWNELVDQVVAPAASHSRTASTVA